MSAVQQIILHPIVTQALKVAATTVGRDKVYRAVQYYARFLAFAAQRTGKTNDTVNRLQALKSSLSTSRKLMRIGKPFEHWQAAVKAIDVADPVVKATTITRQLGYASYLVLDSFQWAHSAKVNPLEKATIEKVQKWANRFWAIGLAANIVAGVYKLQGIDAQLARLTGTPSEKQEEQAKLAAAKKAQYATRYQLLQDSLDFLLPTGSLGYHSLDDGILGLAGCTTALLGLNTQIKKVLG